MATVAGTITDVQLVNAPFGGRGARKVFLLSCTFAQYTATDTAAITAANTAIAAFMKNGATVTLRQAMGGPPGLTAGGTAVYALNATINTASIQCNLGTTTADASTGGASTAVGIYVSVDES